MLVLELFSRLHFHLSSEENGKGYISGSRSQNREPCDL